MYNNISDSALGCSDIPVYFLATFFKQEISHVLFYNTTFEISALALNTGWLRHCVFETGSFLHSRPDGSETHCIAQGDLDLMMIYWMMGLLTFTAVTLASFLLGETYLYLLSIEMIALAMSWD